MMQKSIPAWPSVSTRGGDGMITKGPTTISPFWRRLFNEPIRGMESPATRVEVICPRLPRGTDPFPSEVNRNHFVYIHGRHRYRQHSASRRRSRGSARGQQLNLPGTHAWREANPDGERPNRDRLTERPLHHHGIRQVDEMHGH